MLEVGDDSIASRMMNSMRSRYRLTEGRRVLHTTVELTSLLTRELLRQIIHFKRPKLAARCSSIPASSFFPSFSSCPRFAWGRPIVYIFHLVRPAIYVFSSFCRLIPFLPPRDSHLPTVSVVKTWLRERRLVERAFLKTVRSER